MAYIKNNWVDQDVERPKTYEMTSNPDGSVTLIDSFGLVTELGTPVNADNMNHIEDGIEACGITKYNEVTTYSINDIVTLVNENGVKLYISLQDNNVGNDLTNVDYWKEIDLGGGAGLPIGTIYSVACSSSYVPNGALPCDGTEYSKEQFSEFWGNYLIAGLLNTCTYTQYQNDITTYGQCGKFAVDTANEKFKVPTIKNGSYITQALTNGELGKAYNESLPNIYGTFGATGTAGTSDASYAFSKNLAGGRVSSGSAGVEQTITFNASGYSSTYKSGAKVQGDNIRLRYFVQVANGQINQSDMDWSAWASSLQGKMNADHTNDTKPYLKTTYVSGTSGYNIWSNGYCEQWGQITGVAPTVTFTKKFANTNYTANWIFVDNTNNTNMSFQWQSINGKTASSMQLHSSSGTSFTMMWKACGYLASGQY